MNTTPSLNENPKTCLTVTPEVEEFIQERAYYYVARWNSLDETLKTKMKAGTFNWAACLLCTYWMAYRKMYAYATGVFVTVNVLLIICRELRFPAGGTIGLCGGIMALSGTYGSALYKKHVLARLAEIPTNLPDHLRRQAIRDKGGTNWWAPWIFVALVVISYLLPLL